MLVAVKAPHIDLELVCQGQGANEFIEFIRKHYRVEVFTGSVAAEPDDDELINIEDSEFWKKNKHRVLTGARLKAGITQKKLAEITGINKSLLSEYENGKRSISRKTAEKFAAALNTYPEKFITNR